MQKIYIGNLLIRLIKFHKTLIHKVYLKKLTLELFAIPYKIYILLTTITTIKPSLS
jgi:hypothetical protein